MAKIKKNKIQSVDHGSSYIHQHGVYEEVQTQAAGVTHLRNITIDQLQTYFRRTQLTERQYNAGVAFQDDFTRAGIGPNFSTMDLTGVRVSGSSGNPDAVHIARQRLYDALDHVGKPLSSLIVHVVGHGGTAGTWGGMATSKRSGKDGMVALRLALSSLADYYRLT
jgi:hypothetical protein